MTWLLRLYPPVWRRRYGHEVAAILAGRGFSLRTSIDLIAGAIDVWLHPSLTLAAAAAAAPPDIQEKTMLNRVLRFDCSGAYGPGLSKSDQWKANLSLIGSSLLLTLTWMALHVRFRDNPVVDSLAVLPFMCGMLLSMRYTYLKGRSAAVQAVFIGGGTLLIAALLAAAGLLAARI